jgi:hypothetical protein
LPFGHCSLAGSDLYSGLVDLAQWATWLFVEDLFQGRVGDASQLKRAVLARELIGLDLVSDQPAVGAFEVALQGGWTKSRVLAEPGDDGGRA